jgi:hypothetical protein
MDQRIKLSMLFIVLFGLKTNSPSIKDVSVVSDGSKHGVKSARLINSPDFACWMTLGATFAPKGRHSWSSVVAVGSPLPADA